MNLDDFIITAFCLVDEAIPAALHGQRLQRHGPQPTLTDSDVITMEVVGEYLGLSGLAQVLGWSKGRPIGRVEVRFQGSQERLRRLDQAVEIIPPAMTCQPLLYVAPQPLDEIELG